MIIISAITLVVNTDESETFFKKIHNNIYKKKLFTIYNLIGFFDIFLNII